MEKLTDRELDAIEAAGCLLQDLHDRKKRTTDQYEAECYRKMVRDYLSGMAKIYEHQKGGA